METSHSPVLIQHLQETIHSHHFPPVHTPYSLHKNSAQKENKAYLTNGQIENLDERYEKDNILINKKNWCSMVFWLFFHN